MLTIKVLGPGCDNCQKVATVAHTAVADMGVTADIIKVTDRAAILAYNVLATPGLVVNEKLVSAGRIPTEAEVMTWIADALALARRPSPVPGHPGLE